MLRRREGTQRERDEARVAPEGLQHLHERMALLDLRLAVGPDDERGRGREAPNDVLQRLDRRIGAMEVLEDEDERLSLGQAGECPREQLENGRLVLRLPGVDGRPAGLAGHRRAQLAELRKDGEERDEVRGKVREVRARGRGAARLLAAEVVLDQLAEALVSEGAVLLHETALEHTDLPRAGQARDLLDETGLSGSRLARHDGRTGIRRRRPREAFAAARRSPFRAR